MQVRRQPIGQGLVWMRQALNLGLRNPRAIFGAAIWMMAVLYLVAAVLLQPAVAAFAAGGDAGYAAALMWLAPAILAILLLLPVLMGGLMHVIREAELGRPVKATGVFAPFRQAVAMPLAALGIVQLLFSLAGWLLVIALAGRDYWSGYLDALRAMTAGITPTMPEPDHPALIPLVQLVFNYFSYALMLFAIPLVSFSRESLPAALTSAGRATLRNLPTNFFAGALFFGGLVVSTLAVALFAALAMLIGNLVHPAVGAVLETVIAVAFGAALLVVLTGAAYFAWRDTFGDDAAGEAPVVTGIEV